MNQVCYLCKDYCKDIIEEPCKNCSGYNKFRFCFLYWLFNKINISALKVKVWLKSLIGRYMHINCYSCKHKHESPYLGICNGCSGVRNYAPSIIRWFVSWTRGRYL